MASLAPPTADNSEATGDTRYSSSLQSNSLPSFAFTVTDTERGDCKSNHNHSTNDQTTKFSSPRCNASGGSSSHLDPDIKRPFCPPSASLLCDAGTAFDLHDMSDHENERRTPSPTNPDNTATFKNPFNFETKVISPGPVKPQLGQRRGHRYKHSSISHQIFQEPPSRPPLVLPASLPIPTFREAWKSMQKEQYHRFLWCVCHLGIALYVFISSQGSLAMTALSHLVFFDAASGLVAIGVDVLGNFEAWRRSSVRHPFGLERAEVLAGFAMSVFLLFGGFDLVSHVAKHMLEDMGDHHAHHPHSERVGKGNLDFAALASVLATIVSAYGMRNQARIAKLLRVGYLAALPSVLRNPFHFLTLTFSGLLLVIPLLNMSLYAWVDRLVCLAIAGCMFLLGVRLAIAQGLMLLMSYSDHRGGVVSIQAAAKGPGEKQNAEVVDSKGGVSAVLNEIVSDPAVVRVEDAQFWQVHYGLGMANMKLSVARGNSDDASLTKVRQRVCQLIQNRLGEGYGKGGGLRWDVTVQLNSEN